MNSFSREMSLYLAIYISISSNLICITMISTAPGISTGCSYYTTAVTSSIMRVEMSVMSYLFWIWSVNASPDDESKWIKQMCCQNFQLSGAIVIKWVFVLLDLSSHSCQGFFFFPADAAKHQFSCVTPLSARGCCRQQNQLCGKNDRTSCPLSN